MKPRIMVLTLGVDDLERSVKFYRDGLGFPTNGIIGKEFEHGAVAFFDLEGGLKLAVFARADLAIDAGVAESKRSSTEFSIGHNVRSPEEVDASMKLAQTAGASIIKPAQKTFWGGYAGYFQDPDGHMWEVAWNPALLPES
jgi:catechol 2,3-dioxygenase-like lactoylglutathione lyase family enzyme